jgi:hypothetical protein
MKENFKKEKKMERGQYVFCNLEIFLKDFLKIIEKMVKVKWFGKNKNRNMMVNGRMTKCMDLEDIIILLKLLGKNH